MSSFKSKDIFTLLDLSEEYSKIQSLFNINKQAQIQPNSIIIRLKFILKCYQNWINLCQTQSQSIDNDILSNLTIYDLINNYLSLKYNFQSLLRDYWYVTQKDRGAFGYDDDDKDENNNNSAHDGDDLICDISTCFIVNRNEMNRSDFRGNNNKRNKLFFIKERAGSYSSDDEAIKSIMTQQVLDTLHSWVYHSLKLKSTKHLKHVETKQDVEDFSILCKDNVVKKFGGIIESKKASSKRFRGRNSRYNKKNNKFITSNNYETTAQSQAIEKRNVNIEDAVAIYQAEVYGNQQIQLKQRKDASNDDEVVEERGHCCMDELFKVIGKTQLEDNSAIHELYEYIDDEEYESEALVQDIYQNSNTESNILCAFRSKGVDGDLLCDILQEACVGQEWNTMIKG